MLVPSLPDHGLRVFASGSSGNCSLLRVTLEGRPRHYLIDLGLSPRRTREHLAACGLTLDDIEAVLITHFDSDHCHAGWCTAAALPVRVEVCMHRSHLRWSQRVGLRAGRLSPFRDRFHTPSGLPVGTVLSNHDALGSSVFRIGASGGRQARDSVGGLGFATDLGRATDAVIDLLRGVDLLAIESNYCPVLERTSGRSEQLIRRVMGGHGHLSNHEAVDAVRRIEPTGQVVLLHLSRECNRPELVAELQSATGRRFLISTQTDPTPWVPFDLGPSVTLVPRMVEMSLFG